eukprot:gene628-biopygen22655
MRPRSFLPGARPRCARSSHQRTSVPGKYGGAIFFITYLQIVFLRTAAYPSHALELLNALPARLARDQLHAGLCEPKLPMASRSSLSPKQATELEAAVTESRSLSAQLKTARAGRGDRPARTRRAPKGGRGTQRDRIRKRTRLEVDNELVTLLTHWRHHSSAQNAKTRALHRGQGGADLRQRRRRRRARQAPRRRRGRGSARRGTQRRARWQTGTGTRRNRRTGRGAGGAGWGGRRGSGGVGRRGDGGREVGGSGGSGGSESQLRLRCCQRRAERRHRRAWQAAGDSGGVGALQCDFQTLKRHTQPHALWFAGEPGCRARKFAQHNASVAAQASFGFEDEGNERECRLLTLHRGVEVGTFSLGVPLPRCCPARRRAKAARIAAR